MSLLLSNFKEIAMELSLARDHSIAIFIILFF